MRLIEFMKSPKLNNLVLSVMLVTVTFLVGIILFWQAYPYKILEAQEGNYTLDKTTYKQGEILPIHFNLCKHRDIDEDIFGRFIDGVIYSIPQNSSSFKRGCYDTYISAVRVPDNLPEGTYIYEETVVYHPNPLRTITYTYQTPQFTVISSEANLLKEK